MIKKMFFMAAILGAVFFFTVSTRADSEIAFWSMFLGNSWVYDGSSVSGGSWTYRAEVTNKDTTTIPAVETYVVNGFEGMPPLEPFDRQWISINSSEMRQWRIDDLEVEGGTTSVLIDGGSVLAKNPVIVGDQWSETTTGTMNGSPITLSVTTTVQSFNFVTVPLGTFEAYKIHRVITIFDGPTIIEDRWFVPYIGFIKKVRQEEEEIETNVLSSMALNGFTDVSSLYWAYDYIMAIYDAGITTGCAQDDPNTPENERQYCPETNVTREQMAAFIVRAVEGEPPMNYCASGVQFPDVTSEMWSCTYIKRLKELGITTGYNDGTYGPFDTVTREQMAAFIIRALNEEPEDGYCNGGSPFSNVPSDSWSCKYIKRLYELGIVDAVENPTYRPYDNIKRSEMAIYLGRAFP